MGVVLKCGRRVIQQHRCGLIITTQLSACVYVSVQKVEKQLASTQAKLEKTRKQFIRKRRMFFHLTERCFPELEAGPQLQLMRSRCTTIETGLPITSLDEYKSIQQVHCNSEGMAVCTAIRGAKTVALKSFPFAREVLEKELESLLLVQPHPSIIRYTAIAEDRHTQTLHVEMPWYDEGSAVEWMGGRDAKDGSMDPARRSPQEKRGLALQVLQGLVQVHALVTPNPRCARCKP